MGFKLYLIAALMSNENLFVYWLFVSFTFVSYISTGT